MKKVAFVELPVLDRLVPLASGYMEAYARKDAQVREQVKFEKLSLVSSTSYEKVREAVLAMKADVYGFSCYVWNTATFRRLIEDVLAERPDAYILLGGPQVMDMSRQYLDPKRERVLLCNGEGERTFSGFLKQLLGEQPDFTQVKGLSFYKGDELITTPPEPRIRELDEIPSPFLEGLFQPGLYVQTVFETNRGCPFQCTYCYWGGGAIGTKVFQFSEERVRQEMELLARQRMIHIFVADANWGMLKRDVELSKFMADCRKRYGAPVAVYVSSAKNSKDRVQEITLLLADAGLISSQAIALQTLSPETLKNCKRDNIKTSAYIDLQRSLNERGLNSYTEMIWPLPGETLDSFRDGLAELCAVGADSFQVNRLLLMNNVEMGSSREEFGMIAEREPDPASEAEFVVQTKWVSRQDYLEGIRYMNAVTALHNARGLWAVSHYLHTRGKLSFLKLFTDFVDFCRTREDSSPYVKYCEEALRSGYFTRYEHPGQILHLNLHAEREQFDALLEEFLGRYDFWKEDADLRLLFEVDLINRPYVYRNTPTIAKQHRFEQLTVKEVVADGYIVELPAGKRELVGEFITLGKGEGHTFHVNCRRGMMLFTPKRPMQDFLIHAADAATKMRTMSPEWKVPTTPVRRPGVATSAAVQSSL